MNFRICKIQKANNKNNVQYNNKETLDTLKKNTALGLVELKKNAVECN